MSLPEPIRSLDEPVDAPEDPGRRRLFGLAAGMGLGLFGLTGQLWRLQVMNGAAYRDQADNNRFRLVRTDPPRGVIYDRNEQPLARNRPSYAIAVVLADLPKPSDAVIRRLARLLGMQPGEIERILKERGVDRFTPIPVRAGVDPRLAYVVEERHLELPGVQVLVQPVREYVDGRLASHVVGYLGRIDADEYARLKDDQARGYEVDDSVGKTGIELTREAELRGRPGQKRSEVDSTGRELRVLGVERARPGNNLLLTIDLPLQREITRLLTEEMGRFETASAVAVDPRNGQVLAMVHLPSFDNNLFSREVSESELEALLRDPGRPLVNGAVAEAYPPGSAFKIATALAALESGTINAGTKIDCPGALLIPNRLSPGGVDRVPCWTTHGPQDCATALANSCNVFFYHLGGGVPRGPVEPLDIDRLADWGGRLGLGEPTGIELPNEAAGFVPTRTWKRRTLREDWFTGDTYNTAIGQGYITSTPVQLASLISAVANGGRLFRPQVVLRSVDERGAEVGGFRPDLLRDLKLDPDKLRVVQQGLRYSMQIGRTENGTSYTGTSWESELRDLAIAGKTGTAEWGQAGQGGTHGWFVGYAPFDAPQLALSVFLKRGRGGPDAAKIASRTFAYYFGVEAS